MFYLIYHCKITNQQIENSDHQKKSQQELDECIEAAFEKLDGITSTQTQNIN